MPTQGLAESAVKGGLLAMKPQLSQHKITELQKGVNQSLKMRMVQKSPGKKRSNNEFDAIDCQCGYNEEIGDMVRLIVQHICHRHP